MTKVTHLVEVAELGLSPDLSDFKPMILITTLKYLYVLLNSGSEKSKIVIYFTFNFVLIFKSLIEPRGNS